MTSSSSSSKEEDPWLYRGKNLKHFDFPLGGIGTGNILLQGDGCLRGWDVQNQFHSPRNRPLHNLPPLNNDSSSSSDASNCWAISAKYDDDDENENDERQSFLLRSANHYGIRHEQQQEQQSCKQEQEYSSTNFVQPPDVPEISIRARYPIAEVKYQIPPSFPLANVQMETMTPLVPTDARASGFPMAVFVISFENPHPTKSVCVDVMQSTLNFIGWDGGDDDDKSSSTVLPSCIWGGNINEAFAYSSTLPPSLKDGNPMHACKGLFLHSKNDLKEDLTRKGSLALSAVYRNDDDDYKNDKLAENSPTVKVIKGVTSEKDLFWKFKNRDFQDIDPDNDANNITPPSPKGSTYAGAVIQSLKIPPNSSARVTFVLSWHFPYRPCTAARTNLPPDFFGNLYANVFSDAKNVVTAFCDNLSSSSNNNTATSKRPKNLVEITRLFVDSLYSSTIPWQLLESAAGRLAIPRCPTMFRTEAGIVLGNVANDKGPINATHVYGYTTLLERIFPSLSKDMMSSTFVRNFDLQSGGCLVSFGQGGFAIDGALACVIKVYLVVKQSDPNLTFLSSVWPNIKRQMEFILDKKQHFDAREGVITGPQQTTYGGLMNGANTLVGSYLVTALKATEAMANLMGDVNFAKKCSKQAPISRDGYETHCWREDFGYYVADVDQSNCQNSYGTGCFLDQLAGASLSRACGFGSVFDPHREARARASIVRNNVVTNPPFSDENSILSHGDSGLRVCTYPHGKVGEGISSSNKVASGLEYPLAAGLIADGNWQDAIKICSNIRSRQLGLHKSPWNEPEEGFYSARSMSGWNVFDQACGFTYDSTRAAIGFSPRINSDDFSCFCTFSDGFGEFQQQHTCETGTFSSGTASLKVLFGSIQLKSIHLDTTAHVVSALIDGQAVQASIDANGLVTFDTIITIKEDSALSLTLTSPCVTKREAIVATEKKHISLPSQSSYDVNKVSDWNCIRRKRIRFLGVLCFLVSVLYWWIFCLPSFPQTQF